MRKIYAILVLFLMLGTGANVWGQCNNPTLYQGGAAPAEGATTTLSTCVFAGEYSTITGVAAATQYISASTGGAGNYITIRQGSSGGPVIAFGFSPLTWTSTVAGTYFQHINTNSGCGTDATCHTSTIQRPAGGGGCTYTVPLTGSNAITTNTGAICDHAGTGNYSNNANGFTTINPSVGGQAVRLTFTQFNTEAGWDFVTIFDGVGTGGAILYGPGSGSTLPPVVTSTTGPLTILFTSDGSVVGTGFSATISNVPLALSCTYTVPFSGNNAITANSGTICDHAGTADYANGANGFTTINPTAGGQAVRLTFNAFATESCCDFVTIFDGVGTGGTVLYNGGGATLPPVITSTTGPLTIRFISDGSVVAAGFNATISNVALPTNNVPFSGNNSYTLCSGNLYDHGGPSGNYLDNANGYTVLNPSIPGNMVQVSGTVSAEACCDFLRIYNGVGTGGTLLWQGNQGAVPVITSTSGPLTVQFTSDFSIIGTGFNLTIACVLPPPPSPTSITASTNSLCSNSLAPVTLTANGASGTVYWFTSGCNTSGWFTTGNPIVVNPSSTTTYFARNFDGVQWSTTCASTTITVNTTPAAPTVTASVNPICQGGSTNLNATGAGQINWYDAPTGGNLIGTSASGADFNVAPTSNTTYYAETTGPSIDSIVYNESFTQFGVPFTQALNWCTFRSNLLNSYGYVSLTIRGSANPTGITITDPVQILAIADAMRTANLYTGTIGGNVWNVTPGCVAGSSPCGGSPGVVLHLNTSSCNCDPAGTAWVVRPEINNDAWGGLGTGTCSATSQTMEVVFRYNTGSGGCPSPRTPIAITVNPNPTVNAGGALAAICQSTTSAPMGGSVGGGATGGTWSGGAGSWTNANDPANATYTAGAGESGSITLTLTTSGGSCGTITASKTITVNENPTANAGPALAAICQSTTSAPMGGSVGGGATGGTWSGGIGTWTNANDPANATYTADASESGTINLTLTTSGGSCGTTFVTKTLTVNPNPTAAAGPALAAICQGGTSAPMGGSVGGGASGGTWTGGIGTWTNANDPANATYTADASEVGTITLTLTTSGGSCGTTFVTKSINVDASSVAASSINNLDPNICYGASMQLDVVGGSLAPGAQWEWFESTCGSTVLGTGASINVIPNGNTTYLVRATSANSCAPSACTSIAVTMPTASTNIAVNGDVATCVVNANNWIHFYNVDGRLIASVNSAGQNLGNVTATSLVAPAPYIMTSCTQPWDPSWFNAALARSFIITPTTQPTNPVSVRLYILDSEFNDYQAAALGTTGNGADDVASILDMDMTKHSGTSQDGDPLNNCGGGSTIYVPQTQSGLTSAVMGGFSGSYYIEYSISGFSEMFPMNSSNSALPVSMTSFNANCADDKVNISWTTASEFNASHYSLQTSRDGQTWTEVAEIAAAGTTSQETNYFYQDFMFGGVSYYRLVQVDLDGASEIYGPISVDCEINESSMTVYPNPTDADFTVLIQTTETFENATIELVDLSGRSIEVKEMNILPGSTVVKFETNSIMPGTYIVRIKGENDKFTPIRVVVM